MRFPRSRDRAVREMYAAGWSLYSDFRTHHLVGKDQLSRDTKHVVGRCVLFLQTDLAYEWPSSFGFKPLLNFLLYLATFGYARRFADKRFELHGDCDVWPFIKRADYERALCEPKYLKGAS